MSSSLCGIAVLVVDDHADTLELLSLLLREAGLEVRAASHAGEAIAALEGWIPHVLILDINLPDEDGCALLQRIRARPETSRVPAISFSGGAFPRDLERGREAGFDLQIVKPVDFDAVIRAVADLAQRPLGDSPASGIRGAAPPAARGTG